MKSAYVLLHDSILPSYTTLVHT